MNYKPNRKMKQLFTLILTLIFINSNAQTCVSNTSSLNFNGTSNKVTFTTDNGLIITDSITVEAWINASAWASIPAGGSIFCKHSWANGEQGYVLRAGGNGILSWNIAGDSLSMGLPTSWKTLESSGGMTINSWYHVAGTFDGTMMKIYINGVLSGTKSFIGGIIASTAYPPAIGIISDLANGPGRFWTGKLDEVRVWHRALSQSEIQDKMNNHLDTSTQQNALAGYWRFNENTGTLTHDLSGNNNNGTINSSLQWSTIVPFTNGPPKPTIAYAAPLLTCINTAYAYQWFLYNNPILVNGTQQTYTATQTAVYYVQAFDSLGCSTMSDPFPVIITGINELSGDGITCKYEYNQSSVSVMVNASVIINEIVLTDLTGRKVIAEKFHSENALLSFSKPPKGIYLINIYSNNGKHVEKAWFGN